MRAEIEAILPPPLRDFIQAIPPRLAYRVEEIRIRLGRPLELVTSEEVRYVLPNGAVSKYYEAAYLPTASDCEKLLSLISNHSLYALEEELRRGFVTVRGGHRVGLVGKAVVEGGRVKHLGAISGFNIRIAREVKGVAQHVLPFVVDEQGTCCNTLIISPPQCGKTTLLRDLARAFSYGNEQVRPQKVGIVDERSELAGSLDGQPQHDVGPRTDVLDACPKAEGMMMMIRSMSPDILVVDEIGRPEDAAAIDEAIHAGVQLITTVHGRDIRDISRRTTLSRLLAQAVFTRFIVLSKSRGTGTVEGVYGSDGQVVNSGRIGQTSNSGRREQVVPL
ncbi:stage III sporulation protein AA [Numidum massiliense]|uniref:stage III sporulation protein AA n=1 Tax=Numidum massiliense TaxID=1522315 RepID=UPI0006D5667B|nr:stage III sporulation protein AA [Numidum massiliense]